MAYQHGYSRYIKRFFRQTPSPPVRLVDAVGLPGILWFISRLIWMKTLGDLKKHHEYQ
jgi:hypothetical protein